MYTYKATVINVYDADTIDVVIDLGFKISQQIRIRLYNINAPEVRGTERKIGLISRDYLSKLILNKEVIVKTYKDKIGKYGRYLATIYLNERNINLHIANKGYAKLSDPTLTTW